MWVDAWFKLMQYDHVTLEKSEHQILYLSLVVKLHDGALTKYGLLIAHWGVKLGSIAQHYYFDYKNVPF